MEQIRKTVCITGASRGIGRAAALRFAAAGYDLALVCRKNADLLEQTADNAARAASEAGFPDMSVLTFAGDVGNPADCGTLFQRIDEFFGRIDVLVSNAGISWRGLIQDMTAEEWDEMIRTDLSAAFYLSRLAIPRMLREGHGKILFTSSVWGMAGASCEAAYSAAKGGINGFTKALAKELAPSNIQVNAVAPGAVDTEMNDWMSPEERADLLEEIPSGTFVTPEETAELLYSLAEAGPNLTGQIVTLSGGWYI